MELRHLRYFVAVAEAENVSRAALKLHVSQPGVSRQIRDLEDEIGFPLLERGAKSVRLTPAGKVFLPEARAVLQHAADAVNKARASASAEPPRVQVGYAPSLTAQILPPTLRAFQEKFPSARVALHDLSTAEMLSQLREFKLDVALTVKLPAKEIRSLNIIELAQYEFRVAVAPKHPLAGAESVSLEQIAGEPLVTYSREDYPESLEELKKQFARIGRKPRIAGEHDGVASLIAAVEAGNGISLVPSCVECIAGPRLKLLTLRPALPPIRVCGYWRKESENELAKSFIGTAKERAAPEK